MLNAGIPDIAIEPDKTVQKLRDKLKLELDDEEAVKHMQFVIDQSVSSFMARLAENMHSIAQWAKS
jgi:phosphatidylinositol 3-kinase